jgi:drug/metabolite transporter (DMT)-like permease
MKSSRSATAILLIVFSALLFATMDASTKYVGAFIPFALVVWVRFTIQAGLMALWLSRKRGARGFVTAHPRFQLLRGALLVSVSALAFFALRKMPLAEFTAIMMLSPILVTAVSGWLMREAVGGLRWALVCGGFAGTLMVIRPGSGVFGAAAWLPLLTMIGVCAYSLITSRLAVTENPYTTQFYTGATGCLALLPLVLLQADMLPGIVQGVTLTHLLLLAAIGVLGSVGHLMLVMAFGRAGAASLMPFTYTQIGFAALLGWLVFRQAPDLLAWSGMAMIAVCGAATALLNLKGV